MASGRRRSRKLRSHSHRDRVAFSEFYSEGKKEENVLSILVVMDCRNHHRGNQVHDPNRTSGDLVQLMSRTDPAALSPRFSTDSGSNSWTWDRCNLGLRRLIGSRHQSSRPQGWKSADRCHLGLRRLIGSRHQSSPPQGWKSVDRCHLGLRRLIGSRNQSSRPQGWKSVDRCHLGLRRLIGSRHQSFRPQGWKSAGQDINLPDLNDGRVPYHLSKSKMISSPFQNCRTGPVSSWPSSFDRVKTSIFPTSRMEECLSSSGETEEDVASSQKSTFVTGKCFELQSVMQNDTRRCFNTLFPSLQSIFPQAAMKQTDWICQLNDFGRKGPESATTYYFRLKFCLIPSGAKEQTQRIECFDLASSGSKEQIEVVTQRPWMRRNRFGQIKIGAFWSLPDSRFSAMCKEGQL
ncbi:hypothetical protein GQ457_07G004710 [Hibiscus cannabinus]